MILYEFLDRRYAFALYKTCSEAGNVDLVLEQLKEIVDEVEVNEGLRKIIKNPQIKNYNKKLIFKEMFEGDIEDELLSFLLLLIDKGRILYLKEKYIQFKQIILKRNNTVIAKARTVIPLDEEQREKLMDTLQKKYNKIIILEEELDRSLIGGILVTIGNEVLDGSIKGRLEEIRERLEGNIVKRYNYIELKRKLKAHVYSKVDIDKIELEYLRKWLKSFYKRDIEIIIDNENIISKENFYVRVGKDIFTRATIEQLSGESGEVKELRNPDDYLA